MRKVRERKRRAGFRLHQSWIHAAPQVYSDHQRLDARSLAMHCLIARKLLANPALITQVRSTLVRWKAKAAEPVPSYFSEWERVLDGSPEEIAAFLASMREDATRLRQSSPFTNLLTSEERAKIYTAFA
jgi:tRNA-dihydrouridine synthase